MSNFAEMIQDLVAAANPAPVAVPGPLVEVVSSSLAIPAAAEIFNLDVRFGADRLAPGNAPRLWMLVGMTDAAVAQPGAVLADLAARFDSLFAATKTANPASDAAKYAKVSGYVTLPPNVKGQRLLQAALDIDHPTAASLTAPLTSAVMNARWTVGALLPLPIWQLPATGSLKFADQPDNNARIRIAGIEWTFVAAPAVAGPQQTQIGANLAATLAALAAGLGASTDPALKALSFSANGAAKQLDIQAHQPGIGGNNVALDAVDAHSHATASGPKLTGGGWYCDLQRIATAIPSSVDAAVDATHARQLVEADAWLAPADRATGANPVATALALRAALTTEVNKTDPVSGAKSYDAATRGDVIGAAARWNPYAVLFYFYELSIVLTDAAFTGTLVTRFFAALSAPELALFAQTSAGHALLRRTWQWWAKGSAANRGSDLGGHLRAALGLAGDALEARSPANVGVLEPPLSGDTSGLVKVVVDWHRKHLYPLIALGRRIDFLPSDYEPGPKAKYFGISVHGDVSTRHCIPPPNDPLFLISTDLMGLPGAATQAQIQARQRNWGRVLNALAKAEGELDAASAFDGGVFSVGFQQWTAVPNEGISLYSRLKALSDPYFDLTLRGLGIETAPSGDSQTTMAVGYFNFTGNPAAAATVTVGGTTWTFVSAPPANATQVRIGASTVATATAFAAALGNSADAQALLCTYDRQGSAVRVTYRKDGAAGNAFVLTSASPKIKVITLAGGADPDTAPKPDPNDISNKHCFYELSPADVPARCAVVSNTLDSGAVVSEVNWDKTKVRVGQKIFGWHAVGAANVVGDNGVRLCARWAVVNRYAIETWKTQVELAYQRIPRTRKLIAASQDQRDAWSAVFALPGAAKVIGEIANDDIRTAVCNLCNSEMLMAALVDISINTPGFLDGALQRAVTRMLATADREGLVDLAGAAAVPADKAASIRLLLLYAFLGEREFGAHTIDHPKDKNKPPDLVPEGRRQGVISTAPARIADLLQVAGRLTDPDAGAARPSGPAIGPLDPAYAARLRLLKQEELLTKCLSLTGGAEWP